MNEREEETFRAIAMGSLMENPQFREVAGLAADNAAGMFTLMRRYGIESQEDITFVCENGIPCLTVIMHPHMREHFRHARDRES